MARQGQKLVHLHTTGTTATKSVLLEGNYELELGEIAVQHNANDAKLYIRLSDATNGTKANSLGEFITKSAVETLISDAIQGVEGTITTVSGRVTTLETKVGNGLGNTSLTDAITGATASTSTVADNLATEVSRATNAENAIKALLPDSAFTTTNTVKKAIDDEAERAAEAEQGLETTISGVRSDLTAETTRATGVEAELRTLIQNAGGDTEGLASQLSAETEARIAGDEAIEDIIGTGFSAQDTVAQAVTNNATNITTLNGIVSGYTGTSAIKNDVDTVRSTANSALQSISSGASHDYVTVTIGTKTNNDQSVSVAVAAQDIDTATALKQGFADAYNVKTLLGSADTRITALESDNTKLMARTSGFSDTAGSIKTYIDDKVSSSITSVYRVMGSKNTYDQLPTTGNETGDVWNVVSSATVNQKVYPAGTNFVWNGTEWDALGGTVDLSPYMLSADFNTWTSGTYSSKIQEIETSVTTEATNRSNADQAILNTIGDGYSAQNTVASAISGLSTGLSNEQTARTAGDTALQDQIGTGFSSANTIASKISALETAGGTAETRITQAETDIDALEGILPKSAYTSTNTVEKAISGATAATQSVANDLAAEVTARQNADSNINEKIGSGFDSTNTVAKAIGDLEDALGTGFSAQNTVATNVTQNASNITSLNDKLGTGFTSSNTVRSEIEALKTTSNTAIQDVSVANSATNGITATENASHEVTLNFDNMIIDCGTY